MKATCYAEGYEVEIETEWNLKLTVQVLLRRAAPRRDRNRVEFKGQIATGEKEETPVEIETEWNLK